MLDTKANPGHSRPVRDVRRFLVMR